MIPASCAGLAGGLLLVPLLVASWLQIVVAGQHSRQLFDAQRTCLGWFVRTSPLQSRGFRGRALPG